MSSPPATPPPKKALDASSFKKAAVSSIKKKSRATPHLSPTPLRQDDLFDDLLDPRNLHNPNEDHGREPRNFLGTAEANGEFYLKAGDNGHLKNFKNSVEWDMCMSEEFYLKDQFKTLDMLPELYKEPMRR